MNVLVNLLHKIFTYYNFQKKHFTTICTIYIVHMAWKSFCQVKCAKCFK
jgi:hypothetical protein